MAMIFITLGSQKFQFNRLLKAVDDLINEGEMKDNIFAQVGYSDYKPKHYKYKNFLDRNEFSQKIDRSDIVITHGGAGTIIEAVKKGKKVMAVPRLARFKEHIDDHQLQIIEQFYNSKLIDKCLDLSKLGETLKIVKKTEYKSYQTNTEAIIKSIDTFIENEIDHSI